jgi:hypothetical protein
VGLFGKSRFLDADVEDWTLEAWAWLMTNLGGMERLRHARLGTATKDFSRRPRRRGTRGRSMCSIGSRR